MNTTPDGKSNVKVDIETPKAIQKEVKETLNQMENNKTQFNNKGGSVAHQVSAGGGSATGTSLTTKTSPGTGHISAKFPISKSELPHFFSMSFMMFLFIYVFTTVRDTKDTLVVSNCGAEAIPFLKLYAVMPCATAFIVIYSKLSNVLGKQALFYVTLIPFFIFYGIFAFVLFPMRDVIHFPLAEGATGAGGALGKAMNLLRYWSFSLFFVVSELWASAGVPLLFWSVSVFDMIILYVLECICLAI
jgi:ATP/ADP translocase